MAIGNTYSHNLHLTYYSNYIKSKFTASYSIDCNIINCYTCDHSN